METRDSGSVSYGALRATVYGEVLGKVPMHNSKAVVMAPFYSQREEPLNAPAPT